MPENVIMSAKSGSSSKSSIYSARIIAHNDFDGAVSAVILKKVFPELKDALVITATVEDIIFSKVESCIGVGFTLFIPRDLI